MLQQSNKCPKTTIWRRLQYLPKNVRRASFKSTFWAPRYTGRWGPVNRPMAQCPPVARAPVAPSDPLWPGPQWPPVSPPLSSVAFSAPSGRGRSAPCQPAPGPSLPAAQCPPVARAAVPPVSPPLAPRCRRPGGRLNASLTDPVTSRLLPVLALSERREQNEAHEYPHPVCRRLHLQRPSPATHAAAELGTRTRNRACVQACVRYVRCVAIATQTREAAKAAAAALPASLRHTDGPPATAAATAAVTPARCRRPVRRGRAVSTAATHDALTTSVASTTNHPLHSFNRRVCVLLRN